MKVLYEYCWNYNNLKATRLCGSGLADYCYALHLQKNNDTLYIENILGKGTSIKLFFPLNKNILSE